MNDRDWLYRNYITDSKPMWEISASLNVSTWMVWYAIKKHEIKSRTFAEHLRGIPFTEEHKLKMSLASKGKPRPYISGEKNGNWQGGRTSTVQMQRTTVVYNNWKDSVFQRDIFCVACGSTKQRVAHHIKRYQEYPELRFDMNNGVVLCRSCHSVLHNTASLRTGLIRRTARTANSEPAREIAKGSLGVCDGQS